MELILLPIFCYCFFTYIVSLEGMGMAKCPVPVGRCQSPPITTVDRQRAERF